MHVFFESIPGIGVQQVWHTELLQPASSNRPPVVGPISQQSVTEGTLLSLSVTASDPDGNTLTFSLDPAAPAGASIDPASGLFTWTPSEAQGPASYVIIVRVTDNGSPALSATRSFTVVVTQGESFWSNPHNVTRMGPDSLIGSGIIKVDANNTVHYLFNTRNRTNGDSGPVFHTFKRPGELWSQLVQLSPRGYVRFAEDDQRGSLHVLFEVPPGQGEIWHSQLNLSNLAAGWSPNANVSQTASNAVGEKVLVDTNGTLHLVFASVRPGVRQLFHSYKPPGQSWSAPVALNASNEILAQSPLLLADRSASLHVVFHFVGASWHARHATLNINNLAGGWTSSADINWAPTNTVLREASVDAVNTLHLWFYAYDDSGRGSIFHRYKSPGGLWSTPIQVSRATFTSAGLYNVLEDATGRLHFFFGASDGALDQLWHSALDIHNLAAGWSANANVSQSTGSTAPPTPLISNNGSVHVVVPTTGNPASLLHNYLTPGGQWNTPLRIYERANSSFQSGVRLLTEDSESLQLIFEAYLTNETQVLHSQVSLGNLATGWSPVEPVLAGGGSRALIDTQHRLHLVALSPNSSTGHLVHRSKAPSQPWSGAAPIGETGQFARDLIEAGDGTLQLFYGSDDQIWHRELVTPIVTPEIQSVRLAGQGIQVTFPAIPGHSYRLQYKDSLADAQWQGLPGSATINQGTVTLEDATPLAAMRFYRVSLQPVSP
jgi:hypothetical protein